LLYFNDRFTPIPSSLTVRDAYKKVPCKGSGVVGVKISSVKVKLKKELRKMQENFLNDKVIQLVVWIFYFCELQLELQEYLRNRSLGRTLSSKAKQEIFEPIVVGKFRAWRHMGRPRINYT
jgi:hypothetical protein